MAETITKEFYLRKLGLEADYLPRPIAGVKALVIVVSDFGGFDTDVNNYIMLLKATYGDGNVAVSGAGRAREVKTGIPSYAVDEKGIPVTGETTIELSDFTGKHKLSSEDVLGLLANELSVEQWVGKYDQVHFVGHGFPPSYEKGGLIFWEDGEMKSFDEVKAGWKKDTKAWPTKAEGTKIVLAGCDADRGGMKAFLELVVGEGNVYAVHGDFLCGNWKPNRERPDLVVALNWYDKDQEAVIGRIGDFLGVSEAAAEGAGVRPGRSLKRPMELEVRPQRGLKVEVEQ
jgi:hypothetical protein